MKRSHSLPYLIVSVHSFSSPTLPVLPMSTWTWHEAEWVRAPPCWFLLAQCNWWIHNSVAYLFVTTHDTAANTGLVDNDAPASVWLTYIKLTWKCCSMQLYIYLYWVGPVWIYIKINLLLASMCLWLHSEFALELLHLIGTTFCYLTLWANHKSWLDLFLRLTQSENLCTIRRIPNLICVWQQKFKYHHLQI